MKIDDNSFYEKRLQREIERLAAQIAEFKQEKLALERQLIKARRENFAVNDVTRKNSINRVMIERRIMETLERSSRPLSGRELYREARVAVLDLNESTFRTHLHRLKGREIIENAGIAGMWRLVPKEEKN